MTTGNCRHGGHQTEQEWQQCWMEQAEPYHAVQPITIPADVSVEDQIIDTLLHLWLNKPFDEPIDLDTI